MQRERPDLSASLAVDGTVTIVFTDIVDSTLMLSRLGDVAWVEVIRRHNTVIEEVTAAHGGTVVETQVMARCSRSRALAGPSPAPGRSNRDRPRLCRLVAADPGQDRHPHGGRDPGGRSLLRHHRALRRPRRQSCRRRRSARLQSRARTHRRQRLHCDFLEGREVEPRGSRASTGSTHSRPRPRLCASRDADSQADSGTLAQPRFANASGTPTRRAAADRLSQRALETGSVKG